MRRILAVAVTVAAGCDGGGGAPGEPQSGSWAYLATDTVEDSCGVVPLLGLDAGTFELVNNGDGTLTIDDGEWIFDCTVAAGEFDCPDRFPGGFATAGVEMTVVGQAHGTFESDSAGAGNQSGTASCADQSCEAAVAMMGMDPPCEVEVNFTISRGG